MNEVLRFKKLGDGTPRERIVSDHLYEAINYVLQYHDDGNEEFLVTLIKYRDTISFVETFKFNDVKLEKEASSEALDEEPKEDM